MAFIAWLDDAPLSREVAGGKGASLSQLAVAGFPVPAGFVITADAYHNFVEAAGLNSYFDPILRSLDDPDAMFAKHGRAEVPRLLSMMLEGSTMDAHLPDELRDQISDAYETLTERSGESCAVRSSAVAEDGSASSFAGLYDTFLNVRGITDVLYRVRSCYASLFSERALGYRATGHVANGGEAMAVVVMTLVLAEVSGIAFTAHPVTGSRDIVVINSSWGLGEPIVSGRVTPDAFVVEKVGLAIRERQIVEKSLIVRPNASGEILEEALSPEKATAASLTDEQVRVVAQLGVRVEEHCGAPQDVEWAIADGELFVLQSRPITTLG